ncbi:BON domain-containing protein [Amnibacterium sp.]|uniref:BON domain-containing protein n=1 Tax=Amnibacterium sp. TaxID=1872496 RepID=UPI003F7C24E4
MSEATAVHHRPADRPSDEELEHAVQEELTWSSSVDASGIEVRVDHGVVHLRGRVHDLAEDVHVRRAVLRVRGSVGVVDRLTTAPQAGDGAARR